MFPTDLPTLMTIPLELRHQIFKHVAKRDTTPEKLLRYWFEKREVKEKIAELLAKNPDARMPRVVWEGDRFEEEEREESGDGDEDQEDGDEEGDEDDDEDSEDEDDDEDSEDEDEPGQEGEDGDEGDDAEEEDEEMADSDTTAASAAATISAPSRASNTADTANQQVPTNGQQDSATVSNQTATSASALQSGPAVVYDIGAAITVASAAALAQTQGSATGVPANGLGTAQTPNQGQVKDENIDADMAEDEEVNGDAEDGTVEQEDSQMDDDEVEDLTNGGDRDAESDGDEDMEDEEEDQVTTAALAQPPPAPVVTSHRKWRHIPKFMRITHCPPPVELFLASKQLNAEVQNWFYDVAVLHVDATGSFAHTSFFEEALSQITEAAFSPMEDIRKVEVTFVWDSTWLRSDRAECAAAIFPALLRQRAIFVTGILAKAPHLSEVVIHWHDSAEDEEAVDLMNDVLMGFLGLDATVKVEPRYIAVDAKPYRNSIAGKQRVEFGRIVNNGLDRLF